MVRPSDPERSLDADIRYLGAGVSGRLGLRESNTQELARAGLPVLSTPAELAQVLGLTIRHLRWLAYHNAVAKRLNYIHFQVPKKSGGMRTLSAPHRKLAAAQHWILANIIDRLPVNPSAHGFVAGRNILTNACSHTGRAIVINLDLEDFFPSITFPRIRSLFQRLGYSPAVATILALLTTECPRSTELRGGQTRYVAVGPRGLPQGACTSPGLSNQVARGLDRRLAGLAARMGLSYTRYADDLALSGDENLRSRVGYVLARVRHIARDEGFAINEKKTRVLRPHTAQEVTGLTVNDKVSIPRRELRRLRAVLHYNLLNPTPDSQVRRVFYRWLRGKIAFVQMIDPVKGAKFLAQFQQLCNSAPPRLTDI